MGCLSMMSSISAPGKNKQNLSRAVFPWARLRGLDGHITQLATRRSSSFLQHILAGLRPVKLCFVVLQDNSDQEVQ